MEKKENAATANSLGVCEKLYNAIVNRPSLIPLRRPRLTSGANSHVAEGYMHSDNTNSLPPAAKDNQQKTAAAAAATLPKEVPPLQKQNLATKPPEITTPQLSKEEQKNTNILPSVTKFPTRQATIPEKQNVSQSTATATTEKTGRAPTSVLRLATDKEKAAPAVPAPSPPPPAVVQGKVPPPTTPVVQAKAPAPASAVPSVHVKVPLPSAPPTAPQVQAKAPPLAVPPTAAAPAARPAVAAAEVAVAEKPAPVAEKAAPPMRSASNTNDKSDSFIKRARNSWLSSSNLAGTRKQS